MGWLQPLRHHAVPRSRQPLSLKARALQALALREHSRSELRQKLLRGGWNGAAWANPSAEGDGDPSARSAEVDTLLDELQANGLLCESRFIESRVHARAARFGNRRIQAELARHGLRVDQETASQLQGSEFERARQVWQRRFGGRGTGSPAACPDALDDPNMPNAGEAGTEAALSSTAARSAERARQVRFLAARGFTPEVIRRVVKGDSSEE